MTEILKLIATFLIGSFGTTAAIILLIYFSPEKAEKWWSIFLRALMAIGVSTRTLHKKYLQHDIQSRVNHFVKKECSQLPGSAAQKAKIQWVDGSVTKRAVLDGNAVIVRLKRDDPHDKNFVHAVCMFVSKSLLFKAKHYISRAQGEATDLIVSMRLLQREKPSVVSYFLDGYLQPAVDKTKTSTAKVFDDLVSIDRSNLLFPVYLQELNFLGEKVFGGRKDAVIIKEVDELIQFLKAFATRKLGEDDTPDFFGEYCRFSVVIVGRAGKLVRESIAPYVKFIEKKLVPVGVETVYLLAPAKNASYVGQIAESVANHFESYAEVTFKRTLVRDDKPRTFPTYLRILRSKERQLYYKKGG